MADKKGVKLIVTFAERGRGKALAKLYAEQGVFCSYQCMGRGTASSDLLDVLGVGTAEKDILISYAAKETAERLLHKLDSESQGAAYGNGLVFDMPLTALSSLVATVLLNQQNGTGGLEMSGKTDHSLILIAVNQGHTDVVMDTAREAGRVAAPSSGRDGQDRRMRSFTAFLCSLKKRLLPLSQPLKREMPLWK